MEAALRRRLQIEAEEKAAAEVRAVEEAKAAAKAVAEAEAKAAAEKAAAEAKAAALERAAAETKAEAEKAAEEVSATAQAKAAADRAAKEEMAAEKAAAEKAAAVALCPPTPTTQVATTRTIARRPCATVVETASVVEEEVEPQRVDGEERRASDVATLRVTSELIDQVAGLASKLDTMATTVTAIANQQQEGGPGRRRSSPTPSALPRPPSSPRPPPHRPSPGGGAAIPNLPLAAAGGWEEAETSITALATLLQMGPGPSSSIVRKSAAPLLPASVDATARWRPSSSRGSFGNDDEGRIVSLLSQPGTRARTASLLLQGLEEMTEDGFKMMRQHLERHEEAQAAAHAWLAYHI